MIHYFDNVQDQYGNAVSGIVVKAYLTGTTSIVTIYSDNGITPITGNFVTTDANGSFSFYIANGNYDIVGLLGTTEKFRRTNVALDIFSAIDVSNSTVVATGSTANRTLADRFADVVNVKDFGAVGNGVTNDTSAVQAFLNYCVTNNKHAYLPAGTYLCDTLSIAHTVSSHNIRIYGVDAGTTVINKRSIDGLNLLQINASGAGYMSDIEIAGLTLNGVVGNTPSVLYLESIVRSTFRDLIVSNGLIGIRFAGGISNTLSNTIITSNATGVEVKRLSTAYLGGWPNNNDILNCTIVNNTTTGISFDDGRLLTVVGCDIEGNGTNGNMSTAGVIVGANVGAESALLSPGLSVTDTWFEANAGQASVMAASGKTNVSQCYFVNNANAVNDVYISGGKYTLENNDHDLLKILCLNEGPGVVATNYVVNCDFNTSNFDYTKTVQISTRATIGDVYLGNFAGAEALRVVNVANSVNRLQCYGNSTGNAPVLQSIGSDAAVDLNISSFGAGALKFYTNNVGNRQFNISHTASAVNFVNTTGSPTGSPLDISAQGSDTNIDLKVSPKGSGRFQIGTATIAATTPASFTADRILEFKDSSGVIFRIPCRATAW